MFAENPADKLMFQASDEGRAVALLSSPYLIKEKARAKSFFEGVEGMGGWAFEHSSRK